MRRSLIALAALALGVTACPQERPEAARQIPREPLPPAVSLEPPGGDGGQSGAAGAPGVSGDGGPAAARRD